MTDLNDTDRRIVKMLEGWADYYQSAAERNQWAGDESRRVENIGKFDGFVIAIAAIRTGQHKDERYD